MHGVENYVGFLIAGLLLNITPGADTIYILTRSITQGKKAGLYSVLGIASGTVFHILFAAFGLSILLMKSVMLFTFVKWCGAGYLIYLGLKMLLDKSKLIDAKDNNFKKLNLLKIYKQGFWTNLLNPKVGIFFLSLLPQFIAPDFVDNAIPFLILGGTFICTGTLWCLFLVFSASFMTKTLRKNDYVGEILKKISGIVFVSLGLQLLLKTEK